MLCKAIVARRRSNLLCCQYRVHDGREQLGGLRPQRTCHVVALHVGQWAFAKVKIDEAAQSHIYFIVRLPALPVQTTAISNGAI